MGMLLHRHYAKDNKKKVTKAENVTPVAKNEKTTKDTEKSDK